MAKQKEYNRLAEVLARKKVTQYRLHKDSGIAYSQINAYTQNTRQPSLETLFKIAATLGVDPCELLKK